MSLHHSRALYRKNRYSQQEWKFEAAMCKFQFTNGPLSPFPDHEKAPRLWGAIFTCTSLGRQRIAAIGRDANQFGIHEGVVLCIRFNRYLPHISEFQGYNSKDRLSNDAMCERPFPNFHTSDFCGQEPATGESRSARPWREINRQHVRTFEILRMFRTARASLYLDPSPNYGYSAEWALLVKGAAFAGYTRRRRSLLLPRFRTIIVDSNAIPNATLMLPAASSLFDAGDGASSRLWEFKLFFDRCTFLNLVECNNR